jgi:hypothetical protein
VVDTLPPTDPDVGPTVVAVPDKGAFVVVGVDAVVLVVVVLVGGGALAKLIVWVAWSFARSPKAITQLTPAVTWEAVGGQGKLAASVAASWPSLSVPVPGGPTTPV